MFEKGFYGIYAQTAQLSVERKDEAIDKIFRLLDCGVVVGCKQTVLLMFGAYACSAGVSTLPVVFVLPAVVYFVHLYGTLCHAVVGRWGGLYFVSVAQVLKRLMEWTGVMYRRSKGKRRCCREGCNNLLVVFKMQMRVPRPPLEGWFLRWNCEAGVTVFRVRMVRRHVVSSMCWWRL